MNRLGFNEALGRSAPDGNQTAGPAPFLDVRPVDLLDVLVIEYSLHRGDGAETLLHFVEQVALEHARIAGSRVHVVFKNIPAGEDQIVESGERDKFVNFRRAAISAVKIG